MASTATTPEEYLETLPEDRKQAVISLRNIIRKNLPKGFQETMAYGMISYVVPKSLYPAGYHSDPKQPLPFISLGNTKGHIALHHLGLYAGGNVLDWFTSEWKKASSRKLDMGKGCVRFSKPTEIPLELVGQLVSKLTPDQWIKIYESQIRKKS